MPRHHFLRFLRPLRGQPRHFLGPGRPRASANGRFRVIKFAFVDFQTFPLLCGASSSMAEPTFLDKVATVRDRLSVRRNVCSVACPATALRSRRRLSDETYTGKM